MRKDNGRQAVFYRAGDETEGLDMEERRGRADLKFTCPPPLAFLLLWQV